MSDREDNAFTDRLIKSLHERAHVSIWACDRNFEIVLWNSGAETIYGLAAVDAIGSNYGELFVDPYERHQALEDCARVIDDNRRFVNLLAYDTSLTGEQLYMLTNCFRITDSESGEFYQAEIGVEISDFDLKRDEHRSLREAGIARVAERRETLNLRRAGISERLKRVETEVELAKARVRGRLTTLDASKTARTKNQIDEAVVLLQSRLLAAETAMASRIERLNADLRVAFTDEEVARLALAVQDLLAESQRFEQSVMQIDE